MGGGYVLNFSNRTFEEFFHEVVGVDIYSSQFDKGSGSKANRMRAFWDVASKDQLILLFEGLLEAWDIYASDSISDLDQDLLRNIISNLGGEAAKKREESKKDSDAVPDKSTFEALYQLLLKLSEIAPHPRGYAFEKFLGGLFSIYRLAPRASYRIAGEQIDGSFELQNQTYLLEAKWQNSPIGVAELHTFEGKLQQKAHWTRGLFISISGFSPEGLTAFGRGKRTICINGFDLAEILRLGLSFEKAILAKARRAAESGSAYVPIRDLNI